MDSNRDIQRQGAGMWWVKGQEYWIHGEWDPELKNGMRWVKGQIGHTVWWHEDVLRQGKGIFNPWLIKLYPSLYKYYKCHDALAACQVSCFYSFHRFCQPYFSPYKKSQFGITWPQVEPNGLVNVGDLSTGFIQKRLLKLVYACMIDQQGRIQEVTHRGAPVIH